jgi:hypothetical protein
MSVASRQTTCAACGGPLGPVAELEFLIDDAVRMVAVHPGHSTNPQRTRQGRDVLPDDPDDLFGAAA